MATNEISFIPAQTKGINVRDGVIDMEQGHATEILNYLFYKGNLVERKGFSKVKDTPKEEKENAIGLYYYKNIGNKSDLIICTDYNFYKYDGEKDITKIELPIYYPKPDPTSKNPPDNPPNPENQIPPPLPDIQPIFRKWNIVNINNKMVFVNGTNYGLTLNGDKLKPLEISVGKLSGDEAKTVEKDYGVYTNTINCLCYHKNLLFFSIVNTLDIYFTYKAGGNTDLYIVTSMSLMNYFKKGGVIVGLKSWTRTTPEGSFTQLLVFTSRGEIAMFDGDDPNDIVNWKLAGVYTVNEITGYYQDKFIQVEEIGGSLIALTAQGFINISDVIYGLDSKNAFNNKINQNFTQEIEDAIKDNIGLFNIRFSFSSKYFIANIPKNKIPSADIFNTYQYLYDVNNNLWTKMTGVNAAMFEDFRSELYFIDINGTLYKMFDGDTDNGNDIEYSITSTPIVLQNIEGDINTLIPMFTADYETVKNSPNIDLDLQISSNFNYPSNSPINKAVYKFEPYNITPKKFPVDVVHGNFFTIMFRYVSKCRNIMYCGMQYLS